MSANDVVFGLAYIGGTQSTLYRWEFSNGSQRDTFWRGVGCNLKRHPADFS
ncbi:MAG: hypothetical protein O3B25_02435 [Verrucomicrobia bacterium]|nr:hypothetical protein [Verrucomicrobiota bacterium]